MAQKTESYTVITGASSGVGYETAKAFADRGRNLIVTARRQDNLEALKREIVFRNPGVDVVIKVSDLSDMENFRNLSYQPADGGVPDGAV